MPENDPQQTATDDTTAAEPEFKVKNDDGTDNWQELARKWERQAKKNAAAAQEVETLRPKAQQFDALSAASQTELERAQAQSQALQRELETTQRQALIASVALDKGLPAILARRLQGDSREDLETDADELLSQFQASQPSGGPRAPRPDPSQGSSASRGGATSPAQEFAALIQSQTGR